ncbi:DUF5018 domain-containing protein [Danxiaibacter flavus]|uniref:DUF5018 domain-containing protein n=1 Tax=Danxiaibacter flavus TaxID=3049108 RepID=A0ABV3Z9F1_9BACT|nr:DUF5018 domain-containing protein [Chitinophagaceae bacterium DXS]
MKKMLFLSLVSALMLASISSCRKADAVIRKEQSALSDIYLTTEGKGGERLFDPRYSANNDTVYFDVPWYYPVDSDNEVDLTKMIIRSTIPTDAKMAPTLGTVMDLTKPVTLTVTAGNGKQNTYVVVAKKVGDVSITSAAIAYEAEGATQNLEGVIQQNEILFYVLPGTDVTKSTFTYEINKHSKGSIASGTVIDLTNPVPFTVTGVDNVPKTYTLRATEPVKLAYGVGINRKLFTKTAAELSFGANMETSIAVSGDYLVLVRRTSPSKYSVYNRFTGAYVQEMMNPFGSTLSFQMVEDSTGNLLAASWAPKNANFTLYKFKSPLDASPVKVLEWTNNNPAGITADGGVGRRVNVYGDLNKDAIIMAPAGLSDVIYRWRIVGGQVVSNTPEVIKYKSIAGGSSSFLGYYAEAQPVSADANANYFINYQFEVALVNGSTHERITALNLGWPVVFTMPTAYARFNNANYLAIVKYLNTYDLNQVQTSLYDVTQQSKISMDPASDDYSSFNVYNSTLLTGTTNGNGTADICIGFSNNKERMQVYTLLTNGGISAQEFTNYAK